MGDYRAKTQPDGSIVIPAEVSAAAGLAGGAGVVLRVEGGEIRIAPATTEGAAPKQSFPEGHRPVWEIVEEISASVPREEWEKLPRDLALNHDRYLYGAPKKHE
jgi:bifunctional DNA-binding transcriptional regulator/antitoxin component of YhaV-PrlF toxin-antitoxin module